MTDEPRTCRCGKPLRDQHTVCDDCARSLSVALGDIPWLEQELETTISRQKGVDYRTKGGTRSSERPLPPVWSAAEARRNLADILRLWVKFCHDENIRHQSASPWLPADTPTDLADWLAWRVDGLTLHDIGPDAVDEITRAVAHCRRLIDRPTEKQFLGHCQHCATLGDEGRLYAKPGATAASCNTCGHSTPAQQLREGLLTELDDRLLTASEIARMSTYLGLKADRDQVRKRINKWHERGRIIPTSVTEEPAFRFGDVYRMLVTHEYGNDK